MICPNCKATIKEGTRFCSSCGTEIPQANVCPMCGQVIKIGMKYCSKCGSAIDSSLNKTEQTEEIMNNDIVCPICNTTLSIEDQQCHNCHRALYYNCNNCKNDFTYGELIKNFGCCPSCGIRITNLFNIPNEKYPYKESEVSGQQQPIESQINENHSFDLIHFVKKYFVVILLGYACLSSFGLFLGNYEPNFAFYPLIAACIAFITLKKSNGNRQVLIKIAIFLVFTSLVGGIKHQFWGSSDSTMVKTGQEAVLNVLKSPSTAKFISYGKSSKVKPIIEEHLGIKTKDNRDVMLFEVEAQNSFGGMVKSTFFVFYIDGKPIDVVEENSILSPNKSNVIAALNYNGWIGE